MNDHHYAPGASPLITGRAPDDDPAGTQQRNGDSSPRNGTTPPRNDATPPRSGTTHARADTAPPARASDGHAGEHGTPARGGDAIPRRPAGNAGHAAPHRVSPEDALAALSGKPRTRYVPPAAPGSPQRPATPAGAPRSSAGAAPHSTAEQGATAPATVEDNHDPASWTHALPEDLREWAQTKGWRDPLAAVESNYHLEKLIGLSKAGRTLVVPFEDAPPAEVRAFRARLGVPDTPEGYQLPVPPGAPAEFARTASTWLHEAGVPAKAAAQLAARWNEHAATAHAQAEQHYAAESAAQLRAIQAEWGSDYERNLEVARRAALHFLPAADAAAREQQLGKLERALGAAAFLRFMHGVGSGLGEHAMVSSGSPGGPDLLAPDAARRRIAALRADSAWSAAYAGGDAAKRAEMTRLHRMAYPG